ncbi:hypothetical protein BDV29DRAFT_123709 [Aspergillus leporis]|jgi:hypothetical protein|uniref:Uncharacterized protein n=1 Tax=Aspergillus leporis TaxID=41062 RepID=A0A5N5X4S1_9EURO|nr:hypothetical protein BDV29DRAFT_123709 [Aspergillus leporis]
MRKRINLRRYIGHLIAPVNTPSPLLSWFHVHCQSLMWQMQVMILSLMGPRHGRILLTHHDGTSLVIRQSELFNFREKNVAALDTFAQCGVRQPISLKQCQRHYL